MSEWLRATYRVDAPRAEIDAIAAAIAVEQSVEMPLAAIDDRFVLDHVVGRVVAIEPVGPDTADVVVELSAETVGDNVAQLVNMVFGNTSLQPFVELVDLTLPAGLGSLLPGPNGGIAKLRLLTGARGRALTCTAVKPQGLRPDALAARCAVFAAAGIDVIKDDHGMADQARAPFRDRVAACQAAVAAANAETGHAAVYAPSLVGGPRQLFDQAAWAEDQGVGAVLVAPMLVGLAVFADLVAAHPDLVFLGHPSFGGAARVAPPLLIGTIFRGLGADAVIFPNFGGRFSYTPDECAAIATRARSAEPSRPALPVPAGGMTVDRVPELIGFYGHDAMLLIGGGLLTAADPGGAAREFVDTVAAHAAPLQGVAP